MQLYTTFKKDKYLYWSALNLLCSVSRAGVLAFILLFVRVLRALWYLFCVFVDFPFMRLVRSLAASHPP